jgi:hypothetical protein
MLRRRPSRSPSSSDARTLVRWKLLLAAACRRVLGITPFATSPFAPPSSRPSTKVSRRRVARSSSGLHVLEGPWEAFKYNFNREQYGKPPVDRASGAHCAQIGMWWMYFKWQWLRDAHGEMPALQVTLGHRLPDPRICWRVGTLATDRRSFWFFGRSCSRMTLLLIYYLNFKYGYSQAPELGDNVPREVRDRDYFYLWSFSAGACGLRWARVPVGDDRRARRLGERQLGRERCSCRAAEAGS